ncbi:MAG: 2-C-methyl-D-erythritol 4-phosphate cytidylyltransferase [Oscillospiraceae bacterium]
MKTLEYTLKYSVQKTDKKISAVIVAAGKSSRMKGVNKQLVSLKNIPVIIRTMKVFQDSPIVSNIIVVCRNSDINDIQNLSFEYELTKLTDVVEGGNCRAESVKNGIERLDADCDIVLIHDGARPFVDNRMIEEVVAAAGNYGAAACAVNLKDTVKVVNEDGKIISTPNRDFMRAVQTPQGFKANLYREALQKAEGKLQQFTDDCAVAEYAGFDVYTVLGSYKNIKITTPEDIIIAGAFLEEESK